MDREKILSIIPLPKFLERIICRLDYTSNKKENLEAKDNTNKKRSDN
jgi:hypothetical protein